MARAAIVFGVLLILLGAGVYGGLRLTQEEPTSVTALIPAFFGLPILLLGLVALKPAYRKHAMHGVAVLALLGLIAPLGRLAPAVARGDLPETLPLLSLVLMAVLSGALLGLCIKSFVDARRARTMATD